MATSRVDELLVEGRLERVTADRAAAGRMLGAAARHVKSARTLAPMDPEGAYALACDAVRKAVTAHMAWNGLRATSRPGAHRAVIEYAEERLGGEHEAGLLAQLDRMRITRNDMEYAARPIGRQEVDHDIRVADAVVQAVARALVPAEER